jgi:hypothetical protein
MPPTVSQRAADWRKSFVRSATVSTLSLLRKSPPSEIEREIRSPQTPMKAADLPGNSVTRLLLLSPKSGAAQLAPLAVSVDLKVITSFNFPLPTNFANASFVGEGMPIPVRQGVFTGMPVGPVRKLALLSALSAELESASGDIAQTIISHTLEVAVGRGLDAVLFSNLAPTVDAPAGLLFGITPLPAARACRRILAHWSVPRSGRHRYRERRRVRLRTAAGACALTARRTELRTQNHRGIGPRRWHRDRGRR